MIEIKYRGRSRGVQRVDQRNIKSQQTSISKKFEFKK